MIFKLLTILCRNFKNNHQVSLNYINHDGNCPTKNIKKISRVIDIFVDKDFFSKYPVERKKVGLLKDEVLLFHL